jgi:DNA-binding response OmpR family regulator
MKKKVFITEDEEALRVLSSEALKGEGYGVLIARDESLRKSLTVKTKPWMEFRAKKQIKRVASNS